MAFASEIQKGLGFLDTLRTAVNPNRFLETLDPSIDHKVWPQSQYLMYVLYTILGFTEQAQEVRANNDFFAPAGDREGFALDRFCILVEDKQDFALNRLRTQALQYAEDCIALMGLYCLLREHERFWPLTNLFLKLPKSEDYFNQLVGFYDSNLGFFPNKAGPSELYKLSLFAIFAAKVVNLEWSNRLTGRLTETQSQNGGWKTHWIASNTPNPVGTTENLETTALSIIALHLSQNI